MFWCLRLYSVSQLFLNVWKMRQFLNFMPESRGVCQGQQAKDFITFWSICHSTKLEAFVRYRKGMADSLV